jgi:uncharacterized DUF497 family protein
LRPHPWLRRSYWVGTQVEWDDRKAACNERSHGASFKEAVTALMDGFAVTFFDEAATD